MLTLVATPIGNLGDLSPRAVQTLTDADHWLVEDTRVSAKLAFHLGIKKPMRVLNEHTSPVQVERYVAELKGGAKVALLTDGGSPAISDPGAILTDLCHLAGVTIDANPGPSAVITALGLSGFFAQRFVFLGFLGRKAGAIRRELDALGNRRYAICREISKAFQQIYRENLPTIPSEAEVPRLGEMTIVIEGKRKQSA